MARRKKLKPTLLHTVPPPEPEKDAQGPPLDEGALQALKAQFLRDALGRVQNGARPDPDICSRHGHALVAQFKDARTDRTPELLTVSGAPGLPWDVLLDSQMQDLHVRRGSDGARVVEPAPDSAALQEAITGYALERSRLIEVIEGYDEDPDLVQELRSRLLGKVAPTTKALCETEIDNHIHGIQGLGMRASPALRRMIARFEAVQAMLKQASSIPGRRRAPKESWSPEVLVAAQALSLGISRALTWASATATDSRRAAMKRAVGIVPRRKNGQDKSDDVAGDAGTHDAVNHDVKAGEGHTDPAGVKVGEAGGIVLPATGTDGGAKPKA